MAVPPVLVGLGWRPVRSQPERTRREDRRSKFYEISDNLPVEAAGAIDQDQAVDAADEVRASLDLDERLGQGQRAGVEPEREAVGDTGVGVHAHDDGARSGRPVTIPPWRSTTSTSHPTRSASRLHAALRGRQGQDEFEFGCTLLRLRGMESAGWDPFVETARLVDDLLALVAHAAVGHTRVRLGLLLYSHLTEVGAIYDISPTSRVIAGERYVMDPFLDLARNRKGEVQFLSTPATVARVEGDARQDAGHAAWSR